MPPKARITREMVVDAAFEIARTGGAENVNARTVSKRLGCSTQPVMYHFKTIEALKKAAYRRADEFHSAYISDVRSGDPMKDIGLNYIRFAAEEKRLFRFLFQSDSFSGRGIFDLVNAEEAKPIIEILAREAEITAEQARAAFLSVFMCVHGYASLIANNDIVCDMDSVASELDLALYGAISAIKGGLV